MPLRVAREARPRPRGGAPPPRAAGDPRRDLVVACREHGAQFNHLCVHMVQVSLEIARPCALSLQAFEARIELSLQVMQRPYLFVPLSDGIYPPADDVALVERLFKNTAAPLKEGRRRTRPL